MGSFVEVARESISSVEEDLWQDIEMAVDSGATNAHRHHRRRCL